METNKTILLRAVISINDRKTVGTVKDFHVNYEERVVSHYVLGTASLYELSLLPREKVLAVGDTFVTIRESSDLIAAEQKGAKEVLAEKNRLVGLDVFSQAGNRLGVVEGFSFDASSGQIQEFTMNDGTVFTAERFLFFSPEYVFVDLDGTIAAGPVGSDNITNNASIEEKPAEVKADVPTEAFAAVETPQQQAAFEPTPVAEAPTAATFVSDAPEIAPVVFTPAAQIAPVVEETVTEELENEAAAVKELLIGAILSTDVVSADGEFKASKGTVITQQIFEDAQAHDAILLLTISIEL